MNQENEKKETLGIEFIDFPILEMARLDNIVKTTNYYKTKIISVPNNLQ